MLGADFPATMKSQGSHNHHRFDPLTELVYLEQTGKVQTYFDAFELLRSRVVVSEENALEIFLRGLEPAMQKCVRWFGPRDVKGAYLLARLKESTIPMLGVKEDVLLDEIGAETGLKYVLEGSENVAAVEVFDEMPMKDKIGVSDVNMSIEILPEYVSCFQDMEVPEDEIVMEGEHLMYEGGGNKNDMHIESQVAFRKITTRLCHGDNLVTKETTHSTNWPQRYPSRQKCNLRLGLIGDREGEGAIAHIKPNSGSSNIMVAISLAEILEVWSIFSWLIQGLTNLGDKTTSFAAGIQSQAAPRALAESWGTRSFILERFFMPGLSPEDAAARIRQTAEGLHSLRGMLDSMAWRYVIFYIREKSAYLSQDLKNAATTLPEGRRKAYVNKANELVDNMAEFDYYVRTPKVYESYLYYENTLKSIDDLVAIMA